MNINFISSTCGIEVILPKPCKWNLRWHENVWLMFRSLLFLFLPFPMCGVLSIYASPPPYSQANMLTPASVLPRDDARASLDSQVSRRENACIDFLVHQFLTIMCSIINVIQKFARRLQFDPLLFLLRLIISQPGLPIATPEAEPARRGWNDSIGRGNGQPRAHNVANAQMGAGEVSKPAITVPTPQSRAGPRSGFGSDSEWDGGVTPSTFRA